MSPALEHARRARTDAEPADVAAAATLRADEQDAQARSHDPGAHAITIRVGLPIPGGALAAAARAAGMPVLVSANALAVRDADGDVLRFRTPRGLDGLDVALDSGGYVALSRYGSFPWTVEQYVFGLVAAFPWRWWAAMDECCEAEIAHDRASVRLRMAATARLYAQCRRCAEDAGLAAPLPILQGRTCDDYEWSWDQHPASLGAHPPLVGIGSMCRRPVGGRDGVLAVLERLDRVLPPETRVHLFGVHGRAVAAVLRDAALADRVASIDSCAWDATARRRFPTGRSMARRIAVMREWYDRHTGIRSRFSRGGDAAQIGLALDGRQDPHAALAARATARLGLEHGSSGHPSDAPDPVLEAYEDLVAGGEIDKTAASIWLEMERVWGPLDGDQVGP